MTLEYQSSTIISNYKGGVKNRDFGKIFAYVEVVNKRRDFS